MEELDLGICPARYWRADDEHRVAIVLPGIWYSPACPVLWFGRQVLSSLGWSVLELWYQWRPDNDEPAPWVVARLEAALQSVASAEEVLLVGKSLGTYGAAVAAERELPAIWLTPLLKKDAVRAAIGRFSAPVLVVGGTADDSWVRDAVEEFRAKGAAIIEVSADHLLEVPDDLEATLAALGTVTREIASFVQSL
jgi:hypothetical protein